MNPLHGDSAPANQTRAAVTLLGPRGDDPRPSVERVNSQPRNVPRALHSFVRFVQRGELDPFVRPRDQIGRCGVGPAVAPANRAA
jgi:hypothetical protein